MLCRPDSSRVVDRATAISVLHLHAERLSSARHRFSDTSHAWDAEDLALWTVAYLDRSFPQPFPGHDEGFADPSQGIQHEQDRCVCRRIIDTHWCVSDGNTYDPINFSSPTDVAGSYLSVHKLRRLQHRVDSFTGEPGMSTYRTRV